jgi:hypothetical protein
VWADGESRVPIVFWGRSLGTAVAAYAATVRKPDGLVIESGFPDARSIVRDSLLFRILSPFGSYGSRRATSSIARASQCSSCTAIATA